MIEDIATKSEYVFMCVLFIFYLEKEKITNLRVFVRFLNIQISCVIFIGIC